MGFVIWDDESGIFTAGSIRRVSSAAQKTWAEKNASETEILYGTFVAVASEGGVKPISSSDDIVSGIVERDIYGEKSSKEKTVNVIHIAHGDSVTALSVSDIDFTRGDRAYIVATGDDAGKVTNIAAGAIDIGAWIEAVSAGNSCVALTIGYIQNVAAAPSTAKTKA